VKPLVLRITSCGGLHANVQAQPEPVISLRSARTPKTLAPRNQGYKA
jgi:hypothetical protein